MLPEGLEDRLRELRGRPMGRASLIADRQAAVERLVFGTAQELWVPALPLPPKRHSLPPRPVEHPRESDALAGLDAAGRPVLVRAAFGRGGEPPAAVVAHPSESTDRWGLRSRLLSWTGPRLEVVGLLTHADLSHVAWIDHDANGRPVAFATVGVPTDYPGTGAELAWCDWEGDRCTRVRVLTSYGTGTWASELLIAEYDGAGLVRVRAGHAEPSDDPEAALAALEGAAPRVTIWERALHGAEEDPMAPADALAAWVEAVASAAERAVAASNAVEPWIVKVMAGFGLDQEPAAIVADRAYRDGIAGRVEPKDAVDRLWNPALPLLPHFDEEGLRAWRSLLQLRVTPYAPRAAEELQRRLAATTWPSDAVALAFGLSDEPWDAVRSVLGASRLDALLGSVGAPKELAAAAHPPASREELAALLRSLGLPAELADEASWGLALLPGGDGLSQLGGRPRVPDGMPWPASGGRALTHLATIVLSELPDFEGRALLPSDGTLLFLADLTEDGELLEPVVAGENDRVLILHVQAGAATHEPPPPADDRHQYDPPAVLRRRPIRFEPVLTLPELPPGLSESDRLAYERIYEALFEVTPGLDPPGHLILGHPSVVQEDPREPGQINVLHMGWDEQLGFEFLDGGDITFYGDGADVEAGRWERLIVSTASC